jgi:hypothetical protein
VGCEAGHPTTSIYFFFSMNLSIDMLDSSACFVNVMKSPALELVTFCHCLRCRLLVVRCASNALRLSLRDFE